MRKFSVCMMVAVLLLVLVPFTHAQTTPTNSVTLTEAFVNAQIKLPGDSNLTNLTIDLQPGQIALAATVNLGESPLDLALTLVPTVVDGTLEWEATVLTIGGVDLDLAQAGRNRSTADAMNSLNGVVSGAAQDHPIDSVEITDSALTLRWLRADPNDPAFDLVDTAVTMTLTESYVNALPAVTNPANPALHDLSVDFQPDQVTFSGTRTTSDGTDASFSMTMVPNLQNGLLNWTITAYAVGDEAQDAQSIGQMNDDIAGSWRVFFNGIYRSGNFSAITITDTTFQLTWDRALDTGTPSFEAEQGSLVITEEYINSTYQITSPSAYSITNGYADCQPGQVVISADLNLASGTVLTQVTTFVPSVEDGVVVWTITSATLNGEPLDQAIIDNFNEVTHSWWAGIVARQGRDFTVTDVTVTDTEIEISGSPQ